MSDFVLVQLADGITMSDRIERQTHKYAYRIAAIAQALYSMAKTRVEGFALYEAIERVIQRHSADLRKDEDDGNHEGLKEYIDGLAPVLLRILVLDPAEADWILKSKKSS